jgi:hypothetical protein
MDRFLTEDIIRKRCFLTDNVDTNFSDDKYVQPWREALGQFGF